MQSKKIYIFCLLMLTASALSAQTAKQAEDLFSAHAYAEARAAYSALLRKSPTNPLYLYRAARCAQETGDLVEAERLFIQAGTKYPLRNFFLGEIYYEQWRMAEAIAAYEAFLPSIDEQHERWQTVQERIRSAQVIARYLKHVSRVEVLDVRRLPKRDMLAAYPLSGEAGTLRLDSLGASFTTQRNDRQYGAVRDTAHGGRTLLVSRQRLLHQWEQPDTLRATVNSGKTNAYPFVLTDGATLYFASDREDGLGGLDIYMTRYNASLGEWLPAENIGMPFNSPYDDYLFAMDELSGFACFATNRHCVGTDSVEVYKLATGERTFLRDLPTEALVALARLDSIILPQKETTAQPTTPPAATATNTQSTVRNTVPTDAGDSIHFVLNDDAVYTHLADFRSDSARALYKQYLAMEQQQAQAVQMLDSLRLQYSTGDAATRASLQARIPNLSSEIEERRRILRRTLSEIRSIESNL